MRPIRIVAELEEYESLNELEANDSALLIAAQQSLEKAYAPYSQFRVGAAAMLQNGTIILGNNQENVAYPSGLCAERVAIFAAGAQFPDQKVVAMAVVATSKRFEVDYPVTPCGACRQALAEYESRHDNEIRLIMSGAAGKILVAPSVGTLLPLVFNEAGLKVE